METASPRKAFPARASDRFIAHRLEVKREASGATLIDDAYNSNPVGFASALELLDVIAGVLSTEERQAVEASIKREPLFHYRRIPHFPGKGRVSAFFHVLSELFKSTIGGWGFMERTLGNL